MSQSDTRSCAQESRIHPAMLYPIKVEGEQKVTYQVRTCSCILWVLMANLHSQIQIQILVSDYGPDSDHIHVLSSWDENFTLTLCNVKSYAQYNVAI